MAAEEANPWAAKALRWKTGVWITFFMKPEHRPYNRQHIPAMGPSTRLHSRTTSNPPPAPNGKFQEHCKRLNFLQFSRRREEDPAHFPTGSPPFLTLQVASIFQLPEEEKEMQLCRVSSHWPLLGPIIHHSTLKWQIWLALYWTMATVEKIQDSIPTGIIGYGTTVLSLAFVFISDYEIAHSCVRTLLRMQHKELSAGEKGQFRFLLRF